MNIVFSRRGKTSLLLTLASLSLITLGLLQFDIIRKINVFLYPSQGIQCYQIKGGSLPDISTVKPRRGKSIFFHETSCSSFYNGKITITARQACAVESAAKMNPNMDVFLLYTSPGNFYFDDSESDRFIMALKSYRNVNIFHLDYEEYTKGTPVEGLYRDGLIQSSKYAQSHASDVLRYLTLWKYGGIYLDLDVVVIKSLEALDPNYAGSESERNVAAGIMSFSHSGIGHLLARSCLEDLQNNFDGSNWGHNGPGVITRLLRSLCGAETAKDMIDRNCQGFRVYPTDHFYAIPWWNWTMYFDENSVDSVYKLSRNSYMIHVWNKHSQYSKIPVKSHVPYVLYAKKYCPKVVEQCDKFF